MARLAVAPKLKRYQAYFEDSNVTLIIYAYNDYIAYQKAHNGFNDMFGYEWKGVVKVTLMPN